MLKIIYTLLILSFLICMHEFGHAIAASFCSRVLFLKDGLLYTELYKGDKTRQQFFQQILHTQSVLGGDGYDA